jgi:hypothetical protein
VKRAQEKYGPNGTQWHKTKTNIQLML